MTAALGRRPEGSGKRRGSSATRRFFAHGDGTPATRLLHGRVISRCSTERPFSASAATARWCIGGDGQVTLDKTVMKASARKVRRLGDGQVLAGFAGSTADAFTLFERFEAKLKEYQKNLARACVELGKDWRTDRFLRRLEALLVVADVESTFILSGRRRRHRARLRRRRGGLRRPLRARRRARAARATRRSAPGRSPRRRSASPPTSASTPTRNSQLRGALKRCPPTTPDLTPREIVCELDRYIVGQTAAKRAVAIALRNRWRRQQVDRRAARRDHPEEHHPDRAHRRGEDRDRPPPRQARPGAVREGRGVQVHRGRLRGPRRRVDGPRPGRGLHRAGARGGDGEGRGPAPREAAEDRLVELLPTARRLPRAPAAMGFAPPPPPPATARRRRAREAPRPAPRRHARRPDGRDRRRRRRSPPSSATSPGRAWRRSASTSQDLFKNHARAWRAPEAQASTCPRRSSSSSQEEASRLVDQDRVNREAAAPRRDRRASSSSTRSTRSPAARGGRGGGPDVSREGVQRDILPIVEGSTVTTKYGPVKTDHVLFIAAGAFHVSKPVGPHPRAAGPLPHPGGARAAPPARTWCAS